MGQCSGTRKRFSSPARDELPTGDGLYIKISIFVHLFLLRGFIEFGLVSKMEGIGI